MISGWYIVQPKRSDMGFDMINILVGPYPSEASALSHGPSFNDAFTKKYPGERAPLTVMQLTGYALPEGRCNVEWNYNPQAPFAIGYGNP